MRRQSGPAIHGRAFESARGSAAQALPLTLIRRRAPPYAPHPCGAPSGPPAAFAAAPAAAVSHWEKRERRVAAEHSPLPVGEGLGVRVRVPASCLMTPITCRNARLTVKIDASTQSPISCLLRATLSQRRHASPCTVVRSVTAPSRLRRSYMGIVDARRSRAAGASQASRGSDPAWELTGAWA